MTDLPKIVSVPGVMSGDPVIEGTRIRPETVLLEILDGKPEAEILEAYPTLPPGSVQAVIDWARERLSLHESSGYDERGLEVLKRRPNDALRKLADEYPAADIEIVGDGDSYFEIAGMMIATCALGEILTAHPGADLDAVMRWHEKKFGDDLATTYAAREWRDRR
ncbi:DUF433 domain-containing protein [Pelagibacterium flavum]|uniref:DUF433 domain-containing protein n=1 Tax=Pelagibacterium flavum TaxID=2984530 RepID=A0ABY6IS61_9HYPH|nr:DUF433 domain-containing protein [Pelagibacterium sp. YIM 151497]UYQ73461.1 DUF433 domain-containing protein [Pelagibacterium sp. YIM 151497]